MADVPPLTEGDAQALERVERAAPSRTGGRHHPELVREWSKAISRTGLKADELADLYDLYLATPSLWPDGDEGNRLRWPLAWLTLPSGLEATMAHARDVEAARHRAEVRRMAPAELAMRAALMPEASGPDETRAWVAQLPDGRAVYVVGSLVSSTSEDEARSMLASQLDGGIGGAS